MPDDPYSLADLARLADVTPRTVRYYVAQGLLASPDAAGSATRYSGGHLARLRLIRRLQREHLPLAEIRSRLERLGDEEIAALLGSEAEDAPPPAPAETLAFVRDLMAQSGVRPHVQVVRETHASYGASLLRRVVSSAEPMTPAMPPPVMSTSPMQAPPGPAPAAPVPAPPIRAPIGDRTTWERLSITPDVEIHVRRPLDRLANKRVEQLVRIARELFEDGD